jgi:hypothetical protein
MLRRYPALVLVGAAAFFATMLPSALRLPLSGPEQTAELAPVPGKGQAATGNLAEVGTGSSSGLGANLVDPTTTTTPPPARPGAPDAAGDGSIIADPVTKRCVGSPPRQTEDPLSPPCVASFSGDNGGATTKGVTADEIRVVIVFSCGAAAERIDYRDENAGDDNPILAGFQRYFTERYQLWGRVAHFYGYTYSCSGTGTIPEKERSAIIDIDERYDPFAIIPPGNGFSFALADEAAQRGILFLNNVSREAAQRRAPFLLSYAPDLEDRAEIEAAFVCQKLVGRPARYSGMPTDRGTTRRFGLIYDGGKGSEGTISVDGPAVDPKQFAAALARRCGLKDIPTGTASQQGDHALVLTRMRQDGVTTIISYSKFLDWGIAADGAKWYPEWVIPGTPASAESAQLQSGLVWNNAFGITYSRRMGARPEQDWYQAFQEGCPGCTSTDNRATQFDDLVLLFTGVQASGPKLTAANMDRGLHAIPERKSESPFVPAAYFTPGNYSWVKDASLVWWDPTGTAPGGSGNGCYRLVDEGRRSRAADWTVGDDGVKGSDGAQQPCQGAI